MISQQAKTLFSQHYLRIRLPQWPQWQEDPRPAFEAIGRLWQKARQYGDRWNEAQTEREFLQPVLDILGWSYIVQTKSRRGGRISRPDYVLFADEQTRDEAYPLQADEDLFYSKALAIAEVKYWGRPLDKKDPDRRDAWKADSNPSFQMVSYLVGARVSWGILTNGMVWRLYSRDVSSTASEFYEVDLRPILDAVFGLGGEEGRPTAYGQPLLDSLFQADAQFQAELLDAFRRWWLFFRRDAFLPDAEGKSFVQRVHEGSTTYARQVSDRLKELIFEQVMPEIAGGFIAYRYHRLGVRQETPQALEQVYQASLSFLYKLLFLFYAEARGLLPIANPGYREESLTKLARWAAERLDQGLPLSEAFHATSKYEALLALFRRIDQGDPSLGIPRYNGGLFKPDNPENQFLESHRLTDRVVARALDALARDEGQPVDYAYISVRNLGAIYEGLLEYQLQVDDPAAGKVKLVTDKAQRKATGSYYTPDYIVNYIVQHTLTPILDERDQLFRKAMDRCAALRRKLQRAAKSRSVQLLRQELAEAEYDAREAFLGIKVLDPAMGSGHFLVNAVDFLTDSIIRRLQAYHDEHPDVPWQWNPIGQLIERVRQEILAEMDRQGVTVDAARLDDTSLLTRLVMKRCIYGVDLNPLAVELAKLSLWLHSFMVGAPLSFLDHHLRCGNSLLGVDVRTVQRALKMPEGNQLALFAGPFAGLLDLTSLMLQVVENSDATLADVQQSAQIYEQFQKQLAPYKEILDLWMSQYFGNGGVEEFLRTGGPEVTAILRGQRAPTPREKALLDQGRQLAQQKRFFHWDLEFPEVFIDLRRRDWAENPGFHAVIGNPPYGADLDALEEKFIAQVCPISSARDTAEYFLERGDGVVRTGGKIGMIVPKSISFYSQWTGFRNHIIRHRMVTHLLDVGIAFEDVNYEQLVITFQKFSPPDDSVVVIDGTTPLRRYEVSKTIEHLGHVKQTLMNKEGVIIFRPISALEEECIHKILTRSSPLRFLADKVFRGLYIPDKKKATLKPGRYRFINKVPDVGRYAIHRVLHVHLPDARQRQKAEKILKPRLFFKVLRGRRLVVYPDVSGQFLTTEKLVNVVLKPDTKYSLLMIAAVVNSPVPSFYLQKMLFSETTETSRVMDEEYSGRIPIPRIAFTTGQKEREGLEKEGRKLAEVWVADREAEIGPDGRCDYPFGEFLQDELGRWVQERLRPIHTPDPKLVRQHNADPRNQSWQLPEAGPVEQSDVVHDLLAHLAQQMIQMNQEKQQEMQGFLAWLGREIGLTLTDDDKKTEKDKKKLIGHSRLSNYLGDYQKNQPHLSLEELLDLLRRNRRLLKLDPSRRAFQERLAQEYQASLDKLLPLTRRLAATDRLIDLVVYCLYGLAPEEVAQVEQALLSAASKEQEEE